MKEFIKENFLLNNLTALEIYKNIEHLPIIDYHCHLDAREIYENKPFETITDAWLKFDHYKWRAMRIMGVDERFITGNASKYDKFKAYAEVLGGLIGHPLYHFSHIELKRYFDIDIPLSKKTSDEIYGLANNRICELTPFDIIKKSNVELIVTTNDPLENLEYHKKLQNMDVSFKIQPAFRPDKAINIEKEGYKNYIQKLGEITGVKISNSDDIKNVLLMRLDYFEKVNTVATDHGLDYFPYQKEHKKLCDLATKKALNGEILTKEEQDGYKTEMLLFLASEYKKRNMVMELHFGVARNNNTKMFAKIGADSGFDTVRGETGVDNLVPFLDELHTNNSLPKTIIFSLNPHDLVAIATIMGSFQADGTKGYVQMGAAWWFNDTKTGIINHLKEYSSFAPIDSFIGMLTDSRSLLSYGRHEYFRRLLSAYLGGLILDGEYPPEDLDLVKDIAENISYYNTKRFFKQ